MPLTGAVAGSMSFGVPSVCLASYGHLACLGLPDRSCTNTLSRTRYRPAGSPGLPARCRCARSRVVLPRAPMSDGATFRLGFRPGSWPACASVNPPLVDRQAGRWRAPYPSPQRSRHATRPDRMPRGCASPRRESDGPGHLPPLRPARPPTAVPGMLTPCRNAAPARR